MGRLLGPLGLTLVLACEAPKATPAFDGYGGVVVPGVAGTGWFSRTSDRGRDWLVTPTGGLFFSFAVNSTKMGDPGTAYRRTVDTTFASPADWAARVTERYRAWGFNSLVSWKAQRDAHAGHALMELPYTLTLVFSDGYFEDSDVLDYFSPQWKAYAYQHARDTITPYASDPRLIGFFTDNELRWRADFSQPSRAWFDEFMTLDAGAAGKKATVDFLARHYGRDPAAFNAEWGQQLGSFDELLTVTELLPGVSEGRPYELKRLFVREVAAEYFRTVHDAIRAVDAHHLILGCRLVSILTPPEVLQAAGDWVDVLSVNNYEFVAGVPELMHSLLGPFAPATDFLREFHALTGKPIIVSEFGFRATDSGLRSSEPFFYPKYSTQKERADALEAYVRDAYEHPYVLGLHWWRHFDDPVEGRPSDGENNNWGLVDAADVPYAEVTGRWSTVTARVPGLLGFE